MNKEQKHSNILQNVEYRLITRSQKKGKTTFRKSKNKNREIN
jgi:hypothetical protein